MTYKPLVCVADPNTKKMSVRDEPMVGKWLYNNGSQLRAGGAEVSAASNSFLDVRQNGISETVKTENCDLINNVTITHSSGGNHTTNNNNSSSNPSTENFIVRSYDPSLVKDEALRSLLNYESVSSHRQYNNLPAKDDAVKISLVSTSENYINKHYDDTSKNELLKASRSYSNPSLRYSGILNRPDPYGGANEVSRIPPTDLSHSYVPARYDSRPKQPLEIAPHSKHIEIIPRTETELIMKSYNDQLTESQILCKNHGNFKVSATVHCDACGDVCSDCIHTLHRSPLTTHHRTSAINTGIPHSSSGDNISTASSTAVTAATLPLHSPSISNPSSPFNDMNRLPINLSTSSTLTNTAPQTPVNLNTSSPALPNTSLYDPMHFLAPTTSFHYSQLRTNNLSASHMPYSTSPYHIGKHTAAAATSVPTSSLPYPNSNSNSSSTLAANSMVQHSEGGLNPVTVVPLSTSRHSTSPMSPGPTSSLSQLNRSVTPSIVSNSLAHLSSNPMSSTVPINNTHRPLTQSVTPDTLTQCINSSNTYAITANNVINYTGNPYTPSTLPNSISYLPHGSNTPPILSSNGPQLLAGSLSNPPPPSHHPITIGGPSSISPHHVTNHNPSISPHNLHHSSNLNSASISPHTAIHSGLNPPSISPHNLGSTIVGTPSSILGQGTSHPGSVIASGRMYGRATDLSVPSYSSPSPDGLNVGLGLTVGNRSFFLPGNTGGLDLGIRSSQSSSPRKLDSKIAEIKSQYLEGHNSTGGFSRKKPAQKDKVIEELYQIKKAMEGHHKKERSPTHTIMEVPQEYEDRRRELEAVLNRTRTITTITTTKKSPNTHK